MSDDARRGVRCRVAVTCALASALLGCSPVSSGADTGTQDAVNPDTVNADADAESDAGDVLAGWTAHTKVYAKGALASAWSNGAAGDARRWALVGGDGTTGRVLTLTGDTWSAYDVNETGLLWWVHGDDAGHRAAVGDKGTLVTWTEGDAKPTVTVFKSLAAEGTALYGVWFAPGAKRYWIAGGNPQKGTGLLWRVDADSLSKTPEASAAKVDLGADAGVVFKVIGTADGQRWAVGDGGTIWHRAKDTWAVEAIVKTDVLIGISGSSADALVAVGGRGAGVVARRTAKGWSQVAGGANAWISGLSAVAYTAGGAALVGGSYGFLGKQDADTPADELPGVEPPLTQLTLHGAWADKHTQVMVGGSFENPAKPLVGCVLTRGASLPKLPGS